MDRQSKADARKRILAILEEGTVRISGHARKRMADRDVTEEEVRHVLRAGWVDEPELDKGSWRYPVRTATTCVVVVFRREDTLVVVTTWTEG